MKTPSIEVTYRRGKAVAAYIVLGGGSRARVQRTCEEAPGLIVDYARGGQPIGLELSTPRTTTLAAVNRVLRSIGVEPLRRVDFDPLRVA